jgi:hypothetical protein
MTLENEQIIRQAYVGKPQGRLDGPQIHRRHRALRAPGPARERVCMAALRAALHKQDGEPMRLTRTVCPGAVTGTRSSAIQGDGKRLAGITTFTAVRGRSVLLCSGRPNHRDSVTPPHLPGGKPGSGPPPGGKFQQRIDMGERAWSAARPTQPKG